VILTLNFPGDTEKTLRNLKSNLSTCQDRAGSRSGSTVDLSSEGVRLKPRVGERLKCLKFIVLFFRPSNLMME
jgi:hypothetical protein